MNEKESRLPIAVNLSPNARIGKEEKLKIISVTISPRARIDSKPTQKEEVR